MKKAACTAFVNVLNAIHEEGITTKAALMANQALYTDFWFAVTEFCHFALLSKTGRKTKAGEQLQGNISRIDLLVRRGETTRDEIESDCAIKIIDKLDLILRNPTVQHQYSYSYTLCTNHVIDLCRKLPSEDVKIVSLDGAVESGVVEKEDACTYGDLIGDETYSGERVLLERETLRELRMQLRAKQEQEKAGKRNAILQEIASLSKRPAEVLVRLACDHLGMKPRELSRFIIDRGCETAYAEIIFQVARKHDLDLAKLRTLLVGKKVTEASLKLDTNDEEAIVNQLYHLKSRAKQRCGK